jgi:hypothetical protein
MPNKEYLGDGVYTEQLPDGSIRLTVEYGEEPIATIFMEPAVYQNLVTWVERQRKKLAEALADDINPL